jgi:hypothetical protein
MDPRSSRERVNSSRGGSKFLMCHCEQQGTKYMGEQ